MGGWVLVGGAWKACVCVSGMIIHESTDLEEPGNGQPIRPRAAGSPCCFSPRCGLVECVSVCVGASWVWVWCVGGKGIAKEVCVGEGRPVANATVAEV